ncbi:MAG: CHAT domain-containing protein, partial [Bacteroidetes bacterium]|nr:CHAT domain-containing protein [Bacteroidota bacterium]
PLPRVEQILKMRQSIYSYYLQSDSIFGVHAQHSTPDNWKEMGRYFYQELIEKVITDLPERLVIVPDGALGYLPFETFTDQDGQYLVSKTAISYAYSATHFCQLFDRSGKRSIPGKKLLAVSPAFKQKEGVLANAESIRRSYLGPLVYSEQEVKSIQQILGGDILMGSQATKEAFFSMADQYQILHLSSHGKVNDDHPRFSFIAFSGENDTVLTEGEPYVGVSGLYLADLYNLDLNADMVVLSACETGLGKLTQAEGIISLARGFAFAGASSIVTTLWSVNDKTSADLMTLFYENLNQGMPRDQAMQKAKMAFIDENEAPFYWAGYIVIGDPGPIRQPTNWWIYVLVVGIIAIIGFVLIKKSPKRA